MYTLDQETASQLAAARTGDQSAFNRLTDPYRREIITHCYRMLGSLQDAEDQTQETLFAAWNKLETYQARGSFRAWLYKIATHGCLDVLKKRTPRGMPQDHWPPSDPSRESLDPVQDPIFLEPFPDELLAPADSSPEARFEARESITLAFLTALQYLTPRQRSAVLLCDVLDWPIAEAAELLDSTVTAVHSVLYRARLKLSEIYAAPRVTVAQHTLDLETERLLGYYVQAWEAADIDALMVLLQEDATFPMPPLPVWYRGRPAIRAFLAAVPLAGEARGRWQLHPIRANSLPGFALYRRDEATGKFLAYALQVLTVREGLLADVTTFGLPDLFPLFGLRT